MRGTFVVLLARVRVATNAITATTRYDKTLQHCWQQIFDAVVAREPDSDQGRKTLTTVGEWFDNHRYDVVESAKCPGNVRDP